MCRHRGTIQKGHYFCGVQIDHLSTDTIVALATPPGVGALGIIRVSGPEALAISDKIFSKKLTTQSSHTVHFGKIISSDLAVIDEALALIFKSPNSFTGEHVVEFNCHGSPYILQKVITLIVAQGARLARPGEFTMRAFMNGKMDLSQAEGVAELIASENYASHALAMQHMKGGISSEISCLRQELVDFAALIELELDFSEEDVEFADRGRLLGLIHKIQMTIDGLMASFKLGNAIKNGVNTVIAGRPNAGKSTVLNALLKEERAIVSDIPGTTRDTIEEILNINGVHFRLTDTAGIRDALDSIEAAGVERTLEKVQHASLVLYVFDVVQTDNSNVWSDVEKLMSLTSNEQCQLLVVANKMDLNPYAKPEIYYNNTVNVDNLIPTSAANGQNISYLREKIYTSVISEEIDFQHPIISNARHIGSLDKVSASLTEVANGIESGLSGDLLALDIRQALHYLGEITGQINTDDLLESIFSRFCIGK